jgi:hypothetical protein
MSSSPANASPLPYHKTRQVATLLGTNVGRLLAAIYHDRFPAPGKDASGDLIWLAEDIERARAALKIDRRRKEYRASQEGRMPA